jgi:hypothetical protein
MMFFGDEKTRFFNQSYFSTLFEQLLEDMQAIDGL